ncbi:probable WRKY transcription factor 4 [Coffea eugenioides]|uniref:probable WRKY transcription factor 4 n=1 Tax=Coffea eugenioides TaxID=49369 RepID=UPI000F60E281|nr:probable WRKY transcription factor 4 [Coffea eugenioides]
MGQTEMGTETGGAAARGQRRPTITVPPRAPFEPLFTSGSMPGYSPGPMTLLSNIFSPDSNSCSFSQLLAGAMASPIGKPTFFATAGDYSTENYAAKDVNFGVGNDKGSGYKQNRPMGLVVAQSPLFLVPPALSPSGFLNSPGFLSPLQSPFGMSHQQALAHVTAQAALSQSFVQIQADFQRASGIASAEAAELKPSSLPSETLQEDVHSIPAEPQTLKMVPLEASQSDKKTVSFALDKPASDGYNWRKYGQKLVKAKEHPRSYYKCTHPNCPVKKKVERASDGQVTEITYKGQHNHELPQPNTRAKDNSCLNGMMSSEVNPESGSRWQTEVTHDAATSHPNNLKQKAFTQLSSEQFPVASEQDEREDSATVIDEDIDDDDEPSAKRRSTEVGAGVPAPLHKTVTEPKIVVQTRSEVDLLDDGYKWRKYGQKVVKGNPHPRSYYRCTFAGCNVRKHVERASADPKAVITTYEGKHNHDIPAGRNSGQNNVNTNTKLKPRRPVARKSSVDREV